MIIRKATEKDIKTIADIYLDIHTAEENGSVTIGWVRDIYPTEETAKLALQRGDLFVEEDEGLIVGAAIINQKQEYIYETANWNYKVPNNEIMVLHTLVISPKLLKKGYGKKFISFYEEYALSHNCHYLRLDTNEKNSRARAMYKKLGYNEIDNCPCKFNGIEDVRLVLLEKGI